MTSKLVRILGLLLLLAVLIGLWMFFKTIPPKKISLENWNVVMHKGNTLNVKDIRKPALINFWATWCKPCIEELPVIEELHRLSMEKQWSVMAFTYEDTARVASFLASKDYSFNFGSILKDENSPVINTFPTTYFIGTDGEVLWRKVGMLDMPAAEIIKEIEASQTAKP